MPANMSEGSSLGFWLSIYVPLHIDHRLDNRAISRHLRTMAELLLADGASVHKSARFRRTAEHIRQLVTELTEDNLSTSLPAGTDRRIKSIIRVMLERGEKAAFAALPLFIPSSVRELLQLPGIGPRITRRLFDELGIRKLADLKKRLEKADVHPISPELIKNPKDLLTEIEKLERRRRIIPLDVGGYIGEAVLSFLREHSLAERCEITGTVRRMCPISLVVECIAATSDLGKTVNWLKEHGFAEQAVADPTLASMVKGGQMKYLRTLVLYGDRPLEAGVCVTTPEDFAQTWIFSTGDAEHNEVMASLLHRREETAKQVDGKQGRVTAFPDEASLYASVHLPFIEPELREGPSMKKDATLLVQHQHVRGDLHMHSTYSDGRHTMEVMVQTCIARGYDFMAITDHSQSLQLAHGLSIDRLKRQAEEIALLRERFPEITILHGTEVDILADAALDFPDEILGMLDIVVASIHVSMRQSKEELTKRILYAIESPHVDMIGHPTGRMLSRRDSYPLDFERILETAEARRVALELNANPNRMDLDPHWLRLTMETDCLFAINSDAHNRDQLIRTAQFGVSVARKGWLVPERVINTWGKEKLLKWLGAKPIHSAARR